MAKIPSLQEILQIGKIRGEMGEKILSQTEIEEAMGVAPESILAGQSAWEVYELFNQYHDWKRTQQTHHSIGGERVGSQFNWSRATLPQVGTGGFTTGWQTAKGGDDGEGVEDGGGGIVEVPISTSTGKQPDEPPSPTRTENPDPEGKEEKEDKKKDEDDGQPRGYETKLKDENKTSEHPEQVLDGTKILDNSDYRPIFTDIYEFPQAVYQGNEPDRQTIFDMFIDVSRA